MGGQFLKIGSTPANMLAAFNPVTGTLTPIPNQLAGSQRSVNAMTRFNGTLVVGGSFSGGLAAQTDGGFGLLAGGVKNPGFVFALTPDATRLWLGGNFVTSTNTAAYVASWDGTQTAPLNSDPGPGVFCLARDGNDLWVGGDFIAAVNVPTMDLYGIGRYNLGTGAWTSIGAGATVGNGLNGRATVDAILATADFIYAGGDFANMNGQSIKGMARFRKSTSAWEPLPPGSGVNGMVMDMAFDGAKLYVVGLFTQAGGLPAKNVAIFDTTTSTWSTLPGGGIDGQLQGLMPQVLAVAVSGKDLYFAGAFSTAGGLPSAGFAHYRFP